MKGLLLAGGRGTRLRPLTLVGNKHMLPVANKPILLYGLEHLRDAGVKEVGIIRGPIREGIEDVLKDGSPFGVRITYLEQPEPKGIAHAILCAREFLGNDPFLMYLGDNLLEHGADAYLRAFDQPGTSAVVGVTAVRDPRPYGVLEMGPHGEILSIEEKPAHPRSDLALIGVYLFSPAVHDVVASLRPSARGELEITDAIRELHRRAGGVRVVRLDGWWKDTGQPEDLLEANEMVLSSRPPAFFQVQGTVHPKAHVSGRIAVGLGSVIEEGCRLRGPVVLGRDVRIEMGAYIGPYTAVGDGSVIRRAEIDRGIVMDHVTIDTPRRLVDSIVGRGTTISERTLLPKGESFIVGDASRILL